MQNKVNFNQKTGKKWCHFLNSSLSRIYMRNSLVRKEIKIIEPRSSLENAMPFMFGYTSGWGKMSRSSQKQWLLELFRTTTKNPSILNTNILGQKSLKQIRGLHYCVTSQIFHLTIYKENSIFMFYL